MDSSPISRAAAQFSVPATGGTHHVFKQPSGLEAGSGKAALFYPATSRKLASTREFKGLEALRADRTSQRKVDADEQTRYYAQLDTECSLTRLHSGSFFPTFR